MNRIKQLLNDRGLRQRDIVEKLGVTRSTASQWCSNIVQPPVQRLYDLSELLDVEVSELLVPRKKLNK